MFEKKDWENPDIVEEEFKEKDFEIEQEIDLIQQPGEILKEQIEKENINKPYPKKTSEELEKQTKDNQIIETMKNIQDPELGIDIWTLGLIYDIKEEDNLGIIMTFTSPMCPFGPQIVNELKSGLKEKGYKDEKINVELVFNPLWQPGDELREMLGV